MLDAHHAELAFITAGATAASILVADAVRATLQRGALEWRRGRVLTRSTYPGPFRMGVLMMQGLSLGLLIGAALTAVALFDLMP